MRRPLIIGNWKMYKSVKETIDYIKKFKKLIKDVDYVDIGIAPSFTAIQAASQEVKDSNIIVCAQNVFWEEEGAYDGEIAPKMIKEFCSHVLVGHSERRKYFNETNETVNKRVKAAISVGLKVVLCVGETLEERKVGKKEKIIEEQLKKGLKDIDHKDIIVAYEPVWAISGGDPNHKAATAGDAQEMHIFVRKILSEIYSETITNKMNVLYGGSMKPENVKELMAQPDIDGGLVGGASLDVEKFTNTVKFNQQKHTSS